MAETVLRKTLCDDKSACRRPVPAGPDGEEMPEYTPDFVKAGRKLRSERNPCDRKRKRSQQPLKRQRKTQKAPTLIEFIIDPEEMVYPMIQPGGTLEDMIMDC